MSNIEEARLFDKNSKPAEAMRSYQIAIKNNEAVTLDDYINAAILFFLTQDYGFRISNNIPDDIENIGWGEANNLLDLAEKIFGSSSEIKFWRLYFYMVVAGGDPFEEECRELMNNDKEFILPCFYLISSFEDNSQRENCEKLLDQMSNVLTEKARYIKSILSKRI